MRRLLLALSLTLLMVTSVTSQTSGRVYRMAIIAPAGPVSRLTETGYFPGLFQAGQLGLSLVGPPLDTPIGEAEYRRVFAAMTEQRPDALLVSDYSENMAHRHLIADLARMHRLPAVYPFRPFAEAGGLIAYAPDTLDLQRHAARMIDAI